jgi:enoyl-CoA hydratase/carnithine racemase
MPVEPAVRYTAATDHVDCPGVGLITLCRPDNRNSMTAELLDAFAVASASARADAAARAIIITGQGSCFSSGADFKAMIQRDDSDNATPAQRSYAMYQPFLSVLDIEVPVIGALNGHAVGGGFGLALCCDIRIGSIQAKYGANFARLGLHPGMAITALLPRLVGTSRAAQMLYSAQLIDGGTAEQYGILSSAVTASDVMPAAQTLALTIAQNAPLAVKSIKLVLNQGLAGLARAAALQEAGLQAASLTTEDAQEGIAALLAKRTPQFQGR